MGAAFTPDEQLLIKKDLITTARKYLAKYGMKKTSVDQLVAEVGISKGAFYKFYETKEALFFDVLESVHEEIYIGANKLLAASTGRPPQERMEEAMLYALSVFSETSILNFLVDEFPSVLRKLPKEKIASHAEEDSINISALLNKHGIFLPQSPEFISSLVRAMASLAREKAVIGDACYEDVLKFLIHSACTQLLPN